MPMATATHMVGSTHSSSMSPPSPWHPVLLVPNNHQVLYDDALDLATSSTFPSPTTPAATASPPRHTHSHLRPKSRRAGKPRHPRQSRKLPTTYISADAASFRRMVHQVTGFADDDVPLLHLHGGPVVAAGSEVLLCRRQAPVRPPSARAGLETATLLLPTLDTSAFLMHGAARPAVSYCHGSAAAVVDPGAALQVKAEEACDGAGLPSLDSWDDDDALF